MKKLLATYRSRKALVTTIAVACLLLLTAELSHAQTVNLDRNWQLLKDEAGTLTLNNLNGAQGWRDVRVGLQWNAQFADMRDYMGVAWYRTQFDVPQFSTNRRTIVRFGAVDYFSEVWINGTRVGAHEGGYTPFHFDITEAVRPGRNEMILRVVDPPMNEAENRARFPEMMYNELPHGKQNWYVQTGGIWQPVTLEFRLNRYIESVHVTPQMNGEVSVTVRVAASGTFNGMFNEPLSVTVRNPSGGIEFTETMRARDGGAHTLRGRVRAPRLWQPGDPALYSVEVALGDSSSDTVRDRFGFRSFEARDGRFYLNGEPYYMIAALDQDFYPETIYTPPSEHYVREMMLRAKRMGLNMLRCHIKVPDPMYLRVADEVGMLVWYEIPSWNDTNHFSPRAAERGETILREMTERDWNHPSIVVQSIINESWGANLREPEQRRWLLAAFERARQLLAPRGILLVDNSACCDNFHLRTDIDDFHRYNSIPDEHAAFDRWVADFASRPAWTFSTHGDAARTRREPLVVSEFGNWGLPHLPAELPWWFDRDFAGREVTRPRGVRDRFREFGFGSVFADYNALAEATQQHQWISLKHEIEEMRRYSSIQGYVITELTDINWEANGLMDMWRQPKVYARELAQIQQPDVVLARFSKRNFMSGETVQIENLISHYSDRELNGARVSWTSQAGDQNRFTNGRFEINRSITRASVERFTPTTFVAPEVEAARREELRVEVRGRDGALIAENSYEIFVYPRARRAQNVSLVLHDPAGSSSALAQALRTAGYQISTTGGEGANNRNALMIATTFDDAVARHLRAGGRAILLLDAPNALPANAPFRVAARAGSDLDGNWVTNFNWIRADANSPFRNIAFTPILGFEAASTTPRHVIQGLRNEDYNHVSAGIFYGWLNNNAALLVGAQTMGGGKLLATTFRFPEYGTDPYATHLLNAMIERTSASDFAPGLQWRIGSE